MVSQHRISIACHDPSKRAHREGRVAGLEFLTFPLVHTLEARLGSVGVRGAHAV